MKEKWRKGSAKFAVIAAILLVLTVALSMPFAWNGTLSVKAEGTLTMEMSGPLYELIASESSTSSSQEISVSLPANPWMVAFAPTYCNGGDTFLLMEVLIGMGEDFDRQAAGYMDNPFSLSADMEQKLDTASVAMYVVSILVVLGMVAMAAVCIISITGKLNARAAFIASLVFLALTAVQFIFGIAACSERIPSVDGTTVTIVPGAFMIVSVVLGALMSAVTGVWMKKCDGARADYLEIKAEIDKK